MEGKRGEIWFAEMKGKKRPVVIVSNDYIVAEVDRTIANITSHEPRNEFDITIKYWEEAGLDKPSVVRCSKLNTFHNQRLLFRIGKLESDDLDVILQTIKKFFS